MWSAPVPWSTRLWCDPPPESARNLVQGYVAHLRRLLEPTRRRDQPPRLLLTRPPGYLLAIRRDQVDAWRFEQLVDDARRLRPARPTAAAAMVREALALWRGDVLADLADFPVASAVRSRLVQVHRACTVPKSSHRA
jgi:DNA-binding SARP family transcriptional activator